MRELSLFTGSGGGVYGTKLVGARCVAYVEHNPYCQAVIRQRIRDGVFEAAPIFDDVRTFDGNLWKGRVDLLSAGFPCTPFSSASAQKSGSEDERNLWPQVDRIIREVRPSLVFLENSPNVAFSGYLGAILSDLWSSGYDAQWSTLSASQCGAPHQRDRLWLLAALPNTDSERLKAPSSLPSRPKTKNTRASRCGVIHGTCSRVDQRARPVQPDQSSWWSVDPSSGTSTPASQSRVARVVDGSTPGRVERVRALGNGQVPTVVSHVFRSLLSRLFADM